jgi:hypothetical protein
MLLLEAGCYEWAWPSADGLELYISVTTLTEESLDLALAKRASAGASYSLVRLLDELSSKEMDAYCTASSDGLELFFETTRDGIGRIYVARRPGLDQPFSAPQLVPELNGNFHAGDPELSRDGRTIYFVADADILTASRECK